MTRFMRVIHVFLAASQERKTWMARTSRAMTRGEERQNFTPPLNRELFNTKANI
jgi:hypothetical protein